MDTTEFTTDGRQPRVGESVLFFNPQGLPSPGLITAVHGEARYDKDGKCTYAPLINVVFTSLDEDKTDPYGRQIERASSVSHWIGHYAHGMYWAYPDDEIKIEVAETRS